MGIQPRDGILDIQPYKPGSSEAPGIAEPVKLSSNENALGCSPKAKAAFESTSTKLHLYPDGGATKLRQAIAREEGIEAENIVLTAKTDLSRLNEETRGLQLQRTRLLSELKTVIDSHRRLVETQEELERQALAQKGKSASPSLVRRA